MLTNDTVDDLGVPVACEFIREYIQLY